MLTVTSMFPDISEPNGNWIAARIMTARIISPNIEPILFVGMSCFGIAFPIVSLRDSLPAWVYSGFVCVTSFCMI